MMDNLEDKATGIVIILGLSALFLSLAAVVSKHILETGEIYLFGMPKVINEDVNGNGDGKSEKYVIIGGERFYSVIDGKRADEYIAQSAEKER